MVNPQPQATPSPEQHCPRKTQIARTSRQYKIKRDTKTGRLKGRVNQVVSLMVKGGIIELIGVWNEDGNDDGFDPYLKVSVREGGNFATKSGIFKLADRRGPPDGLYEYLPSPQERRKVTGEPFARHWYMRLVKPEPNEDCIEIRKKIVNSVAHVSCGTCRLPKIFDWIPLQLMLIAVRQLTSPLSLIHNGTVSEEVRKRRSHEASAGYASKYRAAQNRKFGWFEIWYAS